MLVFLRIPRLFEERFGFAATEEQIAALKAKAEPFMLKTDTGSPLDSLTARTQIAPTSSPASGGFCASCCTSYCCNIIRISFLLY